MNYPTLLAKIEPKVIHSEEQNETFIRFLEELDSRWDTLTPAEKEIHELLLLLVQDFEERTYKLVPADALLESQ